MEDWDLEPPQSDNELRAESRRQGLAILYEGEDAKLAEAKMTVPLLDWFKGQAVIGKLRG
jgi:hypothetical protein